MKTSKPKTKLGRKLIARLWHPIDWPNHPIVVRIGRMHYELDHGTMLHSEATFTVQQLGLGKPLFTKTVTENTPNAAMKVIDAYVNRRQ